MRFSSLSSVAAFAVIFFGCAPSRIALKPSVLEQPDVRIGIAATKHSEAQAYKFGNQGLLDLAVNSMMDSDLRKRLGKLEFTGLSELGERISAELKRRNISAKVMVSPVDLKAFPRSAGSANEFLDRDLGALGRDEQIDYLILLTVDAWGTIRTYFGVFPMGAPSGYCRLIGRMIDLKTSRLLWQTRTTDKDSIVPTAAKWDNPPEYPELIAAIDAAITNGKDFLYRDLFPPVQQ